MIFNIGDRVEVVRKAGNVWVTGMEDTIGKHGTVVALSQDDCKVRLDYDPLPHFYNAGSLKLISRNQNTHGLDELKRIIAKGGEMTMPIITTTWGKYLGDKGDFGIRQILSNPAKGVTTVVFEDSDVVMVRCSDDDVHNLYFAVASAVAKKVYGNNTRFKKIIDEKTKVVMPKKSAKEYKKAKRTLKELKK